MTTQDEINELAAIAHHNSFGSRVMGILARITTDCAGVRFWITVEADKKTYGSGAYRRIYIQVVYSAPDTHSGQEETWSGRKWYLSEHMTDDEIIKTAYAAFEAAVKHEIMEGFKVDGKILFNPHVSVEALLSITDKEVHRV